MPSGHFVLSEWIGKLTGCLQEFVSYERHLESELMFAQRRIEMRLGIPSGASHDSEDSIRQRVSRYTFLGPRRQDHHSGYGEYISQKLRGLLEVMLEHPRIARASDYSNGEWVFGIDLGVSRVNGFQMTFMLRSLVDYALEHSPESTANDLAELIQKGDEKDLSIFSAVLFRGLHVESRYDFPGGPSIVSLEEARQYMPDRLLPSRLRENGGTDDRPISAVVSEVKWGPVFVPIAQDMEHGWPASSETFRDDALLLVDLLALTHELRVVSAGWRTSGVERRIERLVGRAPSFDFAYRHVSGRSDVSLQSPTTPVVSAERVADCAQLYSKIPKDDVRLRLALSRLASSLSRTGIHAAFDKVIDVAIALEVLYEIDAPRGKGDQLSRRARHLIGRDREDNNWIKKTAKELYDLRSDIAHGALPEYSEQTYLDGLRLGRRTLAHVVQSGRPANWDRR